MSALLYRFSPRTLGLALLVLVAGAAVAFLIVHSHQRPLPARAPAVGPVAYGDQAIAAIPGDHLTVRLRGRIPPGYSLFATLTAAGRQLWTVRLEPQRPLGTALPTGDYALALVASPCAGDCAVLHPGAVGLTPLAFTGGRDLTAVVSVACRRTAGALDCSRSRLRLLAS